MMPDEAGCARLNRYYEAGCDSVWLGDGARWQPLRLPVGLPGYHVNLSERSRPAEAAARPKEIQAPKRDRGNGTARRHSRCRWFRAHRPGAHLLQPDRIRCTACSPGCTATSAAPGRPCALIRVIGREDRWVAGVVSAALTAGCQLCRR
jgi:hypothetical protein